MKILVVEDDRTSSDILTAFFEKSGFEVIAVSNGHDAIESVTGPEPPCMVILDWNMPDIDGLAVCRTVREKISGTLPYIIMLTVRGDRADVIRALSEGADDYVSKPYDPEELKARIDAGVRQINYIKQITDNEKKIRELLTEKEILLKEVHHRIKNNITSIESLIQLQSDSVPDSKCRNILVDAAARIQSMRLVYEKLLPTEDYGAIPLGQYMDGLLNGVKGLFPETGRINLTSEAADVELSQQILIPLGTIINELVTNSMKYAFQKGEKGSIGIKFAHLGGTLAVNVKDDGSGFPAGFDPESSSGFGLMLVKMLTKQLRGNFHITGNDGVECRIEIPV